MKQLKNRKSFVANDHRILTFFVCQTKNEKRTLSQTNTNQINNHRQYVTKTNKVHQ